MWTDALTPLRLVARSLLLLVVLAGLVPVLLCINRVGRRIRVGQVSLEEFMIRQWSRTVCRAFGVRIRTRGTPSPGPVLIVANHLSWIDIQVLHGTAAMGFVGKSEIGTWPVLGLLARAGDTIFHERGNHDSSAGVAAAVVQRLKAGRRVAIFPEGGIRPGAAVGVFHARMFRVAVEADCPVQPVMIRYLRDGRPDPEMTFINNENMITNMLRMLGRPACEADIRYLDTLAPAGRPRKEIAAMARAAVARAYQDVAERNAQPDG
jgi:1-acyl-sn-glycerol-3-phosphate acyltransferase